MYNASVSEQFGSNNTYAGSALDTYCNSTFYGTLSSAMDAAIVDKTFQQDSWTWNGGDSSIANYAGTYETTNNYILSLMSTTFGSSISRKCYALSCQDVIDYLEVTTSMGSADTTLNSENVWKMFYNQTTSPGGISLWLRSANSSGSDAFYVTGTYGSLFRNGYVRSGNAVHPAFQIDLSKIEWSPVGGVTDHTLTWNSLDTLTVTVDGAFVTSPYTLTKDCTIVATVKATMEPGLNSPTITINDELVTITEHTATVNINNSDVSIFATKGDTGIEVTINYTT